MNKKQLKPKKWDHYPTDDLKEKGNKVVQSNLFENITLIVSVILISGGLIWAYWIFG